MVRVLIVDDDDILLDSLCRVMEKHGYESVGAATGAEAIEIIEKEPVDAVILDYMLPDITGDKLALKMGRDIPYVFLTGIEEGLLRDVNLQGAVFKKPPNYEMIVACIDDMISFKEVS
ncbi:MAG: response regulator [Pseudobacteriovorax sp.]|nr:response regulator [Pseudobacteriovorax sp.]